MPEMASRSRAEAEAIGTLERITLIVPADEAVVVTLALRARRTG
jgi:hypothetical protein